jgi:hypothetical protein
MADQDDPADRCHHPASRQERPEVETWVEIGRARKTLRNQRRSVPSVSASRSSPGRGESR